MSRHGVILVANVNLLVLQEQPTFSVLSEDYEQHMTGLKEDDQEALFRHAWCLVASTVHGFCGYFGSGRSHISTNNNHHRGSSHYLEWRTTTSFSSMNPSLNENSSH